MNNLRQTNEIGENDQFVIYQGDNAGFASVPQREALQSIKDLIDFNSIQRELQYLNENKVDNNNFQVFDENVITWSGETQEYENKQFLTTVLNYSELGDIVAENGRAVYVKKNGIAGVFVYVANSPKVHDGGVVIKDSQNRIWVRCIEGEPNLEWFEGVSHADALQSCMDQFNFCRLGSATYAIDKPITLKDGATILGRGRGSVLSITYPTSVFVPTKEIGSLTFSDFWVKPAVTRNQDSFLFDFKYGVFRSTFSNLWFGNENYNYTAGLDDSGGFFNSGYDKIVDTVTFHNCWLHRITGTGYNFGSGSSAWIIGGRVIGLGAVESNAGSIGIKLNGGFGGIWIFGTDVIGLENGMVQDKGNGKSNREVFLVSGCFDSCKKVGYQINDDSCRIHCTNLWAASSGEAQVVIGYIAGGNNTILEINGGQIFNTNVFKSSSNPTKHGLLLNGGRSAKINNVFFDNNGVDGETTYNLFCANKIKDLTVTGCSFNATKSNTEDRLAADESITYTGNMVNKIPRVADVDEIGVINFTGNSYKNKVDFPEPVTPAIPLSNVEISFDKIPFDCMVYFIGLGDIEVYVNNELIIKSIASSFRISPNDKIKLVYPYDAPTWVFKPIF